MSQFDDLPAPPRAGIPATGRKPLGKLAQSAQGKEIKKARIALIAAGLILILQNGIFYAMSEVEVDAVLKLEVEKLGPGMVADPAELAQARTRLLGIVHVIYGAFMGAGAVLVGLGIAVTKYPLAFTITGLVIYLGTIAIFAVLNPLTLASFWLIKLIVIVCLFKAIQAAAASNREIRGEVVA